MSNKTPIEQLDKSWICDHLSDVTKEKMAWVLLQEPGFIGFGIVQQKDIWWPPNIPTTSPDWTLTNDFRLFGEKGEWHVWRDWDGKHYARLLELQNINDDDCLTEYHALWGTKKEGTDTPPWIKVVENRGAEIWLPLQGQVKNEKNDQKNSNLPLRLKLKQIVGYDPDYHLAGVVDAALVALVDSSCKKVLIPTASSFNTDSEPVE